MVNLELYRIFKIVAEEENLTKGSEILHISQPAVTKHIKNLENQLSIKLFEPLLTIFVTVCDSLKRVFSGMTDNLAWIPSLTITSKVRPNISLCQILLGSVS